MGDEISYEIVGGPAREWRGVEENAPSTYLHAAAEALLLAGDPAYLYRDLEQLEGESGRRLEDRIVRIEQRKTCRNATLFAAFAAEAEINAFLQERLSSRDFDALDRLTVVDKYLVGTQTALLRERTFTPGEHPINELADLFRVRNILVHPKLAKGEKAASLSGEACDYTPEKVAGFIIGVAEASLALTEASGDQFANPSAHCVWIKRDRLKTFGRTVTKAVPLRESKPLLTEDDLFRELTKAVAKYFKEVLERFRHSREGESN